uniref:Cytochrome P450 n=1 Tax=Asparagus officinalis TaxID=4686 RepID=Q76M94_ASPOF|nr:cytochrome P450 [Asparagus officinalis]
MPLILVILLLLPILLLVIRREKSTSSKLPPCPPKLPLIGNLHQLGSLPHQSLHALSVKYGPLMLLKLGEIPTLIVSSSDMAREIMRTHDHIFASRPSLLTSDILLNGATDVVFAPYGEHWRQMRKLCVNHLLSAKMVQSFRLMREEEVSSMLTRISGLVNMSEVLNLFTSKILFNAISGKFFVEEEGRINVFCKLIRENIAILAQLSVSDFFPSLGWLDLVFGVGARARATAKKWDDVLDEVIEDHVKRSNETGDADDQEERADFVSVLMALQEDDNTGFTLNRNIIKAILQDMIAAGTETSFLVLDWGMTELVRNPGTMKKLKDEVRSVAGSETVVREEDISKMFYLKAVIKEILRLHPPVPLLIPRESMDHCNVQQYEVPSKTRVLINAWSMGRDPKVWEDPEEFRPERFLDSDIDFRGQCFEFVPFGAGRRICPGMHFAAANLELALANLMYRFDWELPDGMKSEDLDMGDSPGLTTRRRQNLHLVARPFQRVKR